MEWNFDNVKYNGKDLDRVQVDGVTVWEKAKPKFYDYLQSVNGSAFINTGIIANDNTKIEFNAWSNCVGSFYFTGSRLGGANPKILFAVGGKQANKDITLYVGDTDTAINLTRVNTGFSINGWLQTNGNTTFSYYLNYENQTFTDNNVPYSGSISYTIPIYIFSLDATRTISQTTRLYGYKIWQNGILVRDYKPCLYNNQAGLWDSVECKFYGNANNTGTLTVGNDG